MSQHTSIQWADGTVNPTMGCDGCELWGPERKTCYAGKLHQVRGGNPGYAPTFEQVTLFPGRTAKAARWSDMRGKARPYKPWLDGLPRVIFLFDMSDGQSRSVPFDYLRAEVIDVVASPLGQRHIWMWLTKRSARMARFADDLARQGVRWPANLWAGTSVTNRATLSREKDLRSVPAAVRFLSVEPQVEHITLPPDANVDLVIQGGESGPGARPFHVSWARSLMRQCRERGVAYFLKQLGAHVLDRNDAGSNGEPDDAWPEGTDDKLRWEDGQPRFQGEDVRVRLRDSHGGDWSEWPETLRVRNFPSLPLSESDSAALEQYERDLARGEL